MQLQCDKLVANGPLSHFLLNTLPKELNFDGFIISDYDQLTRTRNRNCQRVSKLWATPTKLHQCARCRYQLGHDSRQVYFLNYIDVVKFSIENKTLSTVRLNDAVARILSLKMALGLVKGQSENFLLGCQLHLFDVVLLHVLFPALLHLVDPDFDEVPQAVVVEFQLCTLASPSPAGSSWRTAIRR